MPFNNSLFFIVTALCFGQKSLGVLSMVLAGFASMFDSSFEIQFWEIDTSIC